LAVLAAVQSVALVFFIVIFMCVESNHNAIIEMAEATSPLRLWQYGTMGNIYVVVGDCAAILYAGASIFLLMAHPRVIDRHVYWRALHKRSMFLTRLGCSGFLLLLLLLAGGMYVQVLVAHFMFGLVSQIKCLVYRDLIRMVKRKRKRTSSVQHIVGTRLNNC
jgi:hypothetical protein